MNQYEDVDWVNLETRELSPVSDADKPALLAVYNNPYAELRDKDSRIHQMVTLGTAGLIGIAAAELLLERELTTQGLLAFVATLVIATFLFVHVLRRVASDRLSISQNLDRIHAVMGMHTSGAYYSEGAVFQPSWRAWGSSKMSGTITQFADQVVTITFLLATIDVCILLARAYTLTFTNSEVIPMSAPTVWQMH